MTQPAPPIYATLDGPRRLPLASRLVAAAAAGGCLAVLLTAAWLRPNSAGLGTHTQLGFAPCGFELRSGIPCPTCGMTTSVSLLVHGRIGASLYTQPMGFAIGLLLAVVFWGGLWEAASGRALHRLLRWAKPLWLVSGFLGLVVAAWMWTIYIHLQTAQ